ncbi:MAG: hypothetical protein HZA93_17005 [Verrucomicrobia bacterium]|nr:hypothetical protein [Verrucomicrobiota bacterium]
MKAIFPLGAPLACLALAAAGCQHPRAARIQEHAALFRSLDAFSQNLIENGLVNYGFTPELVYMALGKPSRVSSTATPEGPTETWIYKNFLYASANAAKFGVNNPGTKQQPGPMLSSSAPGGPSLTSTKTSPVQPTVSDMSDTPIATLFLELREGRVVTVRIEP